MPNDVRPSKLENVRRTSSASMVSQYKELGKIGSVTMMIQDNAPNVAPCNQGPSSILQVSDTRVFTFTIHLIQFISLIICITV